MSFFHISDRNGCRGNSFRVSAIIAVVIISVPGFPARSNATPVVAADDAASLSPNPLLDSRVMEEGGDIPGMAGRKAVQGSEWFASQPESNFTLQLLAVRKMTMLNGFVERHPELKGPLGSFTQQRGDERLYVLTQGSYATRTEAEAAAKWLPEGMQPWIRSFAGISRVMSEPQLASNRVPEVARAKRERKDMAWVWSQNPAHYTIQLSDADDEADVEKMAAGLYLSDELAVVPIRHNGNPRFVLLYGSYADRAEAAQAESSLPRLLKNPAPWIRPYSTLQDEMSLVGTEE